jgi:L-iditol 2-dehydrogenase
MEDADRPGIAPEEVLLRVRAAAICGSDVHGMDGSTGRRIPPIVMGHEASGEIAEVGAGVTGWNVGDRVTFDSTLYCGSCEYCGRGEVNLCDHRKVFGVSCGDYRLDGAFAEYVAVNQRVLYALPDEVSFVQAAMIEPLSVAVHAVNRANLTGGVSGRDAAVIGSGMIGLLAIQVLKARDARRIIAVDIDEAKLETAKAMGATDAVNSAGDAVAEIRELTGGRGVDVTFEAVGVEATGNIAVRSLRKGGTAVLIGNVSPSENLPVQEVVTKQLSLLGSCASAGEYPECIELIRARKVDVDAFVSAAAPLSEGAGWFDRLYAGGEGLLKVVLLPNG